MHLYRPSTPRACETCSRHRRDVMRKVSRFQSFKVSMTKRFRMFRSLSGFPLSAKGQRPRTNDCRIPGGWPALCGFPLSDQPTARVPASLRRLLVRGRERASRSGGKGADDKKLGFPSGASGIYSAGLLREPEAWPWSSAAAHCGTAQPDGALDFWPPCRPSVGRY
jgi:hypothetical protein